MKHPSVKQSIVMAGVLVIQALFGNPAMAVLPTPVAPTAGAASGDWLALIKGYIQDGGIVLGLAVSVIGFIWASYAAIAKFNEARQGKAEWGEVGLLSVIAAAVLLFTGYLLNQAATVI